MYPVHNDWRRQYQKAITFSYDDGNTQDIRLLQLFRTYGLRGTFNVNTGLGPDKGTWMYQGTLEVRRLDLAAWSHIYDGHEVAVHGRYHLNLTQLSEAQQWEELAQDAQAIEQLFGRAPVGMAYAYGAYHEKTLPLLQRLGIRYARSTHSTHSFAPQTNLLTFCPTCHHDDTALFTLADTFLSMQPDTPQIFYIWGHSYELEGKQNWDRLERFFEKIAGRTDIFYGTNQEVLLEGAEV